ncbi:hypothetical protein CY35_06G113600 [Sphagnum magellanicum]|nr:hypothetical protein CY35_06G113600 [Sphagnum magellanicum]
MVCIRQAKVDDLLSIQSVNAICLPENYRLNLLYVAEDYDKKIVGYVLGSLDEESAVCHGQIASLAVLRTHRKLGLATKLMKSAEKAMQEVYGAQSVSLHVRKNNKAAFRLYTEKLGYKIKVFEAAYYRDREDAYEMIKLLGPQCHQ